MVNTAVFALTLAIIDFKTKILPNKYVFSLAITSLFMVFFATSFDWKYLIKCILFSTFIFVAFLGIYFISKKTFGLGDVKYSFALSIPAIFLFGVNDTINMHLASFIIGGVGALMILIIKRVSKNHTIAFGPFMSVSYFLFLVLNL
jgi:leader peptidase (prepilin peptidase)/N-methyltransferase